MTYERNIKGTWKLSSKNKSLKNESLHIGMIYSFTLGGVELQGMLMEIKGEEAILKTKDNSFVNILKKDLKLVV